MVQTIRDQLRIFFRYLLIFIVPFLILFVFIFTQAEFIKTALINYYGLTGVVSLSPMDDFNSSIYLSAMLSLVISIPYLFVLFYNYVQLKSFKLFSFVMISLIFSYLGLFFSLLIFNRFMFQFLIDFSNIPIVWSIGEVIRFITMFGAIFSVIPQSIWIFPILVKAKIINVDNVGLYRIWAYPLIFFIAMSITPSDLLSAGVVSIFIIIPLEMGLVISKLGRLKNV